jgi:hypothetical protein
MAPCDDADHAGHGDDVHSVYGLLQRKSSRVQPWVPMNLGFYPVKKDPSTAFAIKPEMDCGRTS